MVSSSNCLNECMDIFATFMGIFGYTLVTINTWNVIYVSDMIYNNVTWIDDNTIMNTDDKLHVSTLIVEYGTIVLLATLWTWCHINKLCYRYYLLFMTYTWCSLAFCECLLIMHWTPNRYDITIAHDEYLEQVDLYLMTGICTIPVILCVGFLIRHIIYYMSYSDNSDTSFRYPKRYYQLFDAVIYDMYEFFMVPVVNVLFVLCIAIVICTMCDDNGNNNGNFESTTHLTNSDLSEKNIGCLHLEKDEYISDNKFHMRMI